MAVIDIDNDIGLNAVTARQVTESFSSVMASMRASMVLPKFYDLGEDGTRIFLMGSDWEPVNWTAMNAGEGMYRYTVDMLPFGMTRMMDSVESRLTDLCSRARISMADGAMDCSFPIPFKGQTVGRLVSDYRRQFWEAYIDDPSKIYWMYNDGVMRCQTYRGLMTQGAVDFVMDGFDSDSYRDVADVSAHPYSRFSSVLTPRAPETQGVYRILCGRGVTFTTARRMSVGLKYRVRCPLFPAVDGHEYLCVNSHYDSAVAGMFKFTVTLSCLDYADVPVRTGRHDS